MKFGSFKVVVTVDKTRLQPSRHPFFFYSQANQTGQTLTMFSIRELVGYCFGWVKPLE